MSVCTVYLEKPIAPGNKDWIKGYLERNDTTGVTVNSRDDYRGESNFFPAHQIQRIQFNTGW